MLFFLVPKKSPACPCANPGNGGTFTVTFAGGGLCPAFCSGVGSWVWSAGTCQWFGDPAGIAPSWSCTYNPATNQFSLSTVGGGICLAESTVVPAVCSAGGVYPIFSTVISGSNGVYGAYTITLTSV